MIKLEIEVFAFLKDYLPEKLRNGVNSVFLENPTSISEFLRSISIPDGIEKIVIVNERFEPPNYVLKDGDVVRIFPPLDGG
jgi:molybdopterin converting factor small subunit